MIGSAGSGASGSFTSWPGWTWNFAKYSAAHTWWEDAHILSDYISAIQAMMQGGTQKVEVAILTDIPSNFSHASGDSFATLMNAGYMYNQLSEAAFSQIDTVTDANANGIPDDLEGKRIRDNLGGPGYQALIVNNATVMSVQGARAVKAIADAGIPVIFIGDNTPSRVYGAEKTGVNTDALMKGIIDGIMSYSNVHRVTSQAQIIEVLENTGITPYVTYDFTDNAIAQVQTTTQLDEDTGTYYYMLYNNNATGYRGNLGTNAAPTVDTNGNPARIGNHTIGADGKDPVYAGTDLNFDISIHGETQYAYEFDLHTQTIKPLDNYTVVDGRIEVNIDLPKNEAKVIIVKGAKETSALFPEFVTKLVTKDFDSRISLPSTGWTMDLESWSEMFTNAELNTVAGTNGSWVHPVTFHKVPAGTPGAIWQNMVNPEFSAKTNVTFTGVGLGIWDTAPKVNFYRETKTPMSFERVLDDKGNDITGTYLSYLALGDPAINSLAKLVGRAVYKHTFNVNTLGIDGIELLIDHNQEMIGYVKINDTVYTKEVHPVRHTLYVDQSALVNGTNTIEILIMTPYGHRSVRSASYSDDSSNWSAMASYGINAVSYRPYSNIGPNYAGVRGTDGVSFLEDSAEYFVWLDAHATNVNAAEAIFTVNDNLDYESIGVEILDALAKHGFGQIGSLAWKSVADGMQGRITLGIEKGTVDLYGLEDIIKLTFDVLRAGGYNAEEEIVLTLDKLSLASHPAGVTPVRLDAYIAAEDASARAFVYSRYDLNKDGKVDVVDLGIVLLALGWAEDQVGWDSFTVSVDQHGRAITPAMINVNPTPADGLQVINMLDALDIIINYTEW